MKYTLVEKVLSETEQEDSLMESALPSQVRVVEKEKLIPELQKLLPHGKLESVELVDNPERPRLNLIFKDSLMFFDLVNKIAKDRFAGIVPKDATHLIVKMEILPGELEKQLKQLESAPAKNA